MTPEDFRRLERRLPERIRYTYSPITQILRLKMPTWAHALTELWLQKWVGSMKSLGMIGEDDVDVVSDATLRNLSGSHIGTKKIADAYVIVSGRIFPTIALETGYSESEEKLKEDAHVVLNGSTGKVGVVILVKMTPVAPGQTMPQDGFVEAWGYNRSNNGIRKIWYRKVLFPPPSDHAKQRLQFD